MRGLLFLGETIQEETCPCLHTDCIIDHTPLTQISSYATHKSKHKQVQNATIHIEEVGMVGPKCTRTRVVGIITDDMHPYTFFTEIQLLENMMRISL